jgi:hypothetical protein
MKFNTTVLISALVFIFLFIVSVHSQDILITVPERSTNVYAGQTNTLNILIKNNRAVKDTFYFSLWGGPSIWTTTDKPFVNLDAGEATNIILKIEPPRDAEVGTQLLSFSVLSLNSNITESKEIYLDIVRGSDIFIYDIELEKQTFRPGETVVIKPTLSNLNKNDALEVLVSTQILKNNLIVQNFDESIKIEPRSSKKLTYSFSVKNINEPGEYEIKVTARNTLNKILDERKTTFNVEMIHKIDEEKETKNSILYSDVTIKITNNGNTLEKNFYVTESMPSISKNFFYPETEPTSQEEKGNRIVYKWLINELDPGQTITIKYQLRFTNVVVIACILIIAIIWIVWLFFRPRLIKNYIGALAENQEITISLNLKNKGRKMLNNVIVKDIVPPLASIVKKFGTLEPKIAIAPTGTQLTWGIKQLKPKEERIITYKIKPVIEITGGFKLPKAFFMFETKQGKKKKILSKTITIVGKVK